MGILLPATSLLGRSLLSLLRWPGRILHGLLPIVLPHYRVAWLVTVMLVVKLLLLLHPGIPIP